MVALQKRSCILRARARVCVCVCVCVCVSTGVYFSKCSDLQQVRNAINHDVIPLIFFVCEFLAKHGRTKTIQQSRCFCWRECQMEVKQKESIALTLFLTHACDVYPPLLVFIDRFYETCSLGSCMLALLLLKRCVILN